MSGIIALDQLLFSMTPKLMPTEYVFCAVNGPLSEYIYLNPVATFQESEGLTLVLEKSTALNANLEFEGPFRLISLTVHSSLDAVGLTAAVSSKLASVGISANVIAAFYHDHIFVQSEKADAAILALQALSETS